MRDLMKRAWAAVASFAAAHPIKVRAGVAGVLVLVSKYVPSLAGYAGSDAVIDFITGALLALIVGDAERVARKHAE